MPSGINYVPVIEKESALSGAMKAASECSTHEEAVRKFTRANTGMSMEEFGLRLSKSRIYNPTDAY